jgi:hypothetical protein
MSSTTRTTKLEEMLDDPAAASSDAGSISNRSLQDAIALDKHLSGKESVTNKAKRMGFRMGVFRAPEHY